MIARDRPLEPTGTHLRTMMGEVTEYLVGLVDGIRDAPVSDFDGVPELLADPELRRPPGDTGRPLAELLSIVDRAAAKGLDAGHPGHLAYIPGSGLVSAAIADLVAAVLNRYTGLAHVAPGLVALEADVIRWQADLFGLPDTAAGVLTSGASIATLSAIVTARDTVLPDDFRAATVYVSSQTHQCVAKAARLAGLPVRAVRTVAVDGALRMDPDALRAAIAADRAAGLRPLAVVANAGSTGTGAVDPLPALADIAAEERIWLHVDAAYGGFFQLTERGRSRLRGIERADSLVVDPHKSLFLPFGTGSLLVRDGELLRRAHSGVEGHVLQDIRDSSVPDFAAYGPELTRDCRGLRMWLPLHLHGVDAFRSALDEKLDLAAYAHAELRDDPHLHVLGAPELSVVAFQHRGGQTAELLHRVNAEARVFLSSTTIDDRYTGRICVLNHRTDRARVDMAVEAVRRHAAALS
ncbi:pyridoxal phosphate-dependent decarboxylase family protein [Virgisporangium aurantiacum]|nr:aminotransferase class I/II-fold pyridoxal phosphate-dependent enzyme [Virgisporangium aurantiacum]